MKRAQFKQGAKKPGKESRFDSIRSWLPSFLLKSPGRFEILP